MTDQFDEATQKAIEKIEKLMRLSASNPNEAEASSALAKAQELLLAYNLDMSTIEQNSGASGKRLDEVVAGGMHKYQRTLWQSIARLNFCMYWTMKVRVKDGTIQAKRKRKWTHEHRLVGRQLNVVATKNMAFYVSATIERLCRERLGVDAHKQFYSSWAVAFREGIADRVMEKVEGRRREIVDAEAAATAKAAREAAKSGISLSRAITVASVSEAEKDANYDFLHGEGASARKKARDEKWSKDWHARQARQAAADAAAEKEAAEWAAAHPEEAAAAAKKEAARERAKDKARERREMSGGYRYRFRTTKADMRRESGAYSDGYETGASVSIDPQMDGGAKGRIGSG